MKLSDVVEPNKSLKCFGNSRIPLKIAFILVFVGALCFAHFPKFRETLVDGEQKTFLLYSIDEVIERQFEIEQDDLRLINKIRQEYVFQPSLEEYNLTTSSVEDPSVWQAQTVSQLLQNKKNGFFVEAGANDGEFISNTLALEKRDGWKGLLVESDPDIFKVLTSKHRKALTVQACLSNTVHPKKLEFQKLGPRSRLTSMKIETNNTVVVQCFPIYSILLAIGRTKIDYFSLDVEGLEFDVLKTIPWDKVEITTISVEYDNIKDQKKNIRKFMENKGYSFLDDQSGTNLAIDYVFYRKDLLPRKEQTIQNIVKNFHQNTSTYSDLHGQLLQYKN